MVVGTLPYMAPEQVRGEEADARTDLFAFGAVLYEMITGARAFAADSGPSSIAAILEHEPAAARRAATPRVACARTRRAGVPGQGSATTAGRPRAI